MPLKLVPATFSDLPKIAQIEEASFASNPLTPIFFPGDKTAETDDAYVESLLQKWQDNLALRTKTVVDTDLNDAIIAFARWFVFVGEDVRFIKTEAGVGGDESGDGASQRELPGSNPEALADFFGALAKLRMELIGERPHCYLSTLCTEPKHQGRGAGRMLLEWGCQAAQQHRVPAFLEATEDGLSLYQKVGFQEMNKFELNLEKYGHASSVVNVQMVKYPEGAEDDAAKSGSADKLTG